MFTRSLLVPALLALLAAAGPAQATSCPQITDPTGDQWYALPHQEHVYETHVDVIEADIASDGTYVTTVIRLVDLQASPGPLKPGTAAYFQFRDTTTSTDFRLQGKQTAGGDVFDAWIYPNFGAGGGFGVPATGTVDLANGEFRIHAKLTDLSPYFSSGDTLTNLLAAAGMVGNGLTGGSSISYNDWTALPSPTYTAGDPACVTPGV